MYRLWKGITTVFVFQLLVGLGGYVSTGDARAAVAGVIVIGVAGTIFVASGFNFGGDGGLRGMIGAIGALALLMTFILPLPVAVFVAIGALGFTAAMATYDVKGNGAEESFWILFPVMLTLGIGTVLGGAILLHREIRKQKVSRPFNQ
ncbi:MAG: hypothetical protein Q8P23_04485 [bacterium]|nr:hypothetical protein [bacterium]